MLIMIINFSLFYIAIELKGATMLKKTFAIVFGVLAISATAIAAGLYEEYNDRKDAQLSIEAKRALSFLKSKRIDVDSLVEMEAIGDGVFLTKDSNGVICQVRAPRALTCFNAVGVKTMQVSGDGD